MGFIQSIDDWCQKVVSDPQWVADCLHRLYRFGGQHPESTVCRHSLEVWWMCRELSPAQQLWALCHDAHEILSGEITMEWKAAETHLRQRQADITLRDVLGIAGIDRQHIHLADIKHGHIEFEALQNLDAGKITRGELNASYRVGWYQSTHEWVQLFEELRGKL